MPIWLRKYTHKQLKDYYENIDPNKEKTYEESAEAVKELVNRPDIKNIYKTKAPKK